MAPNEVEDTRDFFRFTSPARLDKAMHTLEGIVCGIASDRKVTDQELSLLTNWIATHQEFIRYHPFNEIVSRLNTIVHCQIVDEEEIADVIWLSNKFTTSSHYYDGVTSDMQRLQGILHGILADGKITEDELHALQFWMGEREYLRKCWPYDEIDSLVGTVLSDGKIDDAEHQLLTRFFQEFCRESDNKVLDPIGVQVGAKLSGVCAMCPDVVFPEKVFCFTGSSAQSTRKELENLVKNLGGQFAKGVNKSVDYLVVCDEGNQCWAYACYGRKVEKAIAMRKAGEPILLIHENDFRDAVQDFE